MAVEWSILRSLRLTHRGPSRRVAVKLAGPQSWLGQVCAMNPTESCHMSAKSLQSCLTLCTPMDCSPPDSSVHGILQARILEWVALPSSRGSSRPRDWISISYVSCIGRQVLYHWCYLGSPEGCWLGAKSQDQKDPRQSLKSRNRRMSSERGRQNWELEQRHAWGGSSVGANKSV